MGNDEVLSDWNSSIESSSDENPLIKDDSTNPSSSSDDEYVSDCKDCSMERSEVSEEGTSKLDEVTHTERFHEPTLSVENQASSPETVVDIPSTPPTNRNSKKRLVSLNRASSYSHSLMNVALLSANANQLKNLIENAEENPSITNQFSFYLVILSLVLQCLMKLFSMVGICCGCADPEKSLDKAEVMKLIVVIITVVVTLINLSVTSCVFLEDILELVAPK